MDLYHTLICCFVLLLTAAVSDQIIVYSGMEGSDITIDCPSSDRNVIFCKSKCSKTGVLIEGPRVRTNNGRYSMKYEGSSTNRKVSVTIARLSKSDSGLYHCGGRDGYSYNIEVIVIDALVDRNSDGKILSARPGGSLVVQCQTNPSNSPKYFCKDTCEQSNILVSTNVVKVQQGKYSIEYIRAPFTGLVFVSIAQLTVSDSGTYRCAVGTFASQAFYLEFHVRVAEDTTTSKPNPPTSTPAATTLTTSETLNSDQAMTDTMSGVWPYVGLALAVVLILLSVAVLIYWRSRSTNAKEPSMETEYDSISQTNMGVYEDIRDDRFHTNASYNASNANLSQVTYAELNFSQRGANARSAIRHNSDNNVVYSVPQLKQR